MPRNRCVGVCMSVCVLNLEDVGNISSFVCCWFESIVCVLHLSYVSACLQESSLLVQQASLKGELEGVHQQLETSKVLELSFFYFTNK